MDMTTKPEIQPDKLEVLPWMDAAANKFAKYLAQGIKIIPSDYETDLAYDLAREIAAHAPKQEPNRLIAAPLTDGESWVAEKFHNGCKESNVPVSKMMQARLSTLEALILELIHAAEKEQK
jgi:hypothetical protein